MKTVVLNWEASNRFGWGVAGLNLFREWALAGEIAPVMGWPIDSECFFAGEAVRERSALGPFIAESNRHIVEIHAPAGEEIEVPFPVIHAVGDFFVRAEKRLTGNVNIARIVFENTRTAENAHLDTLPYDAVIALSRWNAELLRQHSSAEVALAHEGIDPALFCPGARSGRMDPGRFYILSSGKIEFRKAQDLVLLAFRAFAERHDDALLVTNWKSPWQQVSVGFQGRLASPLRMNPAGELDVPNWLHDNGIESSRVLALDPMPNQLLPGLLRDMDCALLPSRCEGGTNMVATEAMACGIPVVIPRNTGVQDLIGEGNCIALEHQTPVTRWDGADGWGESSVEEMVEALESLYSSPSRRRSIGEKGAQFMRDRTWRAHSEATRNLLFSL